MNDDQRLRQLLDAFRAYGVRYLSVDVSSRFSGLVFWVAPEVENVRRVFKAVNATGVPFFGPDPEVFVRERGQLMVGPFPFWATIVTAHGGEDFDEEEGRRAGSETTAELQPH